MKLARLGMMASTKYGERRGFLFERESFKELEEPQLPVRPVKPLEPVRPFPPKPYPEPRPTLPQEPIPTLPQKPHPQQPAPQVPVGKRVYFPNMSLVELLEKYETTKKERQNTTGSKRKYTIRLRRLRGAFLREAKKAPLFQVLSAFFEKYHSPIIREFINSVKDKVEPIKKPLTSVQYDLLMSKANANRELELLLASFDFTVEKKEREIVIKKTREQTKPNIMPRPPKIDVSDYLKYGDRDFEYMRPQNPQKEQPHPKEETKEQKEQQEQQQHETEKTNTPTPKKKNNLWLWVGLVVAGIVLLSPSKKGTKKVKIVTKKKVKL